MDGLARRYGVHPDTILAGDVSVLQRVLILAEANPEPVADEDDG